MGFLVFICAGAWLFSGGVALGLSDKGQDASAAWACILLAPFALGFVIGQQIFFQKKDARP